MAEADPPGSSRIFISYRREDSAGHVLALLPALRNQFGADRIFKDTDNIPPGEDFVKFIKRELESCSVMLAIIGRDWLTVQDPRLKGRRLDNPDDYLRLEVTVALKNERIRVIPVLVDRGVMPNPEDLPPDLGELSLRNALELSDTRWESDVHRLIQAIKRVSTAPAQPAEGPSQRPELQDLQRRRAREIAAHLQAAQEAFQAGDYEATLWACEKGLVLDPEAREALELMDRARKAIDDRKIDAWVTEAQQLLNRGDVAGASELIDQALAFNHTSEPALTLREELLRLRRDRERDRERARVADAAGERARASLDEEDFEAALRHADDALALDSHSAEAQEIRSKAITALDERRRQREHKRRARQVVTEARAKFATGQHEEALRLLREFGPAHELVSLALLELQKEADVLDQRQQRIAGLMRDAVTAMASRRFQDAVARLREVALIEPDRPDVAALLSEAEAGHAAAVAAEGARREADASLSEASAKFQEQDYAAAQQLIEAARSHDPQHPEVGPWLRRVEDARAEQEVAVGGRAAIQTALAEGRESFEKGELELAIGHADAALIIEPTLDDAHALRERAHAALAERRKREEHERLARQTVEQARQIFNTEDHKAAIDLLERFSPSHALVSQALGELRDQIQEIGRRQRRQEKEEARRREKVERAAAERNRAETLRMILLGRRGRENLDREDFQAALHDANEMLGLDPHSAEAQALRSAASTALEQRIQRDERDRLAQQAAAKAEAERRERTREEARAREEDARRREEEARQREEALTEILTKARQEDEHEAALTLLNQALTLAPGDPRVQTLIAQRNAALEAREKTTAEEAARREQERLAREERTRREQKEKEERARLDREAKKEQGRRSREEQLAREAEREEERNARVTASATAAAQPAVDQTAVRPQPQPPRPVWIKYLAVAAIVVLAITVSGLLLRNLTDDSTGTQGPTPPTRGPTTAGPTQGPTTVGPTQGPTTVGPTRGPTPAGPTQGPATVGPTRGPTTVGPTRGPTPTGPTQGPTTVGPTRGPTPAGPTQGPTPAGPTQGPTIAGPTQGPTTAGPIQGPTTVGPTQGPTTSGPTGTASPVTQLPDPGAERSAIGQLLSQYVAAYTRMDEERLKEIDPTFRGIPSRALLRSVDLRLSDVSITLAPDGQSAVIRATTNFSYVANRARFPPTSTGMLRWNLRKVGSTWTVVP